ncbi:MAG: acyltransferase [Acetobacteraceae bacterium]|nr:acyltransferase [Acetobacteraceae bacterium]
MPRSPTKQIPALTAIRGIAAWWVVLYHFSEQLRFVVPSPALIIIGRGYLAVDLFFVLSGFVIALNYAAMFEAATVEVYLRFLMLRLARIYPLHLFIMLLFLANPAAIALFSSSAHIGQRYDPIYFVASLFLVQNWGFDYLAWNIPAWSISTEWFAYLVFPAIAWVTSVTSRTISSAWFCISVLLIALAAATVSIGGGSLATSIVPTALARCVLEFSMGVYLFRVYARRDGLSRGHGNLAGLAALICFGSYLFVPLPDYALVPLGIVFLIHALTDETCLLSRALSLRALEMAGLVSYSTYLAHYLIKDWTKFLLVRPGIPAIVPVANYLLLVAIASVVLYRYIEVPGRRAFRALSLRLPSLWTAAPARR